MGGEVIRGSGASNPAPIIPRGVQADAGAHPRPRQRQRLPQLPIQHGAPQPLQLRVVLFLPNVNVQAMVDDVVERMYRDN